MYVGGKIQHGYKFIEKVAIYEVIISYQKNIDIGQYCIVVNIVSYRFENPGIAHH